MSNPRISPSGALINEAAQLAPFLAPYLLKADVQLARFVPSFFAGGAGVKAFMSKAFGPEEWELVSNETIILPKGKYIALWGGLISKVNTATAQIALASTSGGVNMSGFNMPTTAYADFVNMPAMWLAPNDGEELWISCTSTVAAPTLTNSNLYLARLGD